MLPNSFPISTNYIFSYNLKYIIFFQTNNIMFFVTVFIGAYLDNSFFLLNLINLIAMNNCKLHLWKVFLFKKALQFLLILDYTKPLMEFLLSRFREWKSQHPTNSCNSCTTSAAEVFRIAESTILLPWPKHKRKGRLYWRILRLHWSRLRLWNLLA